tara:strand:- start:62 stop:295 length:234 start_codon:yes stop_codon:yes gene_type:complete
MTNYRSRIRAEIGSFKQLEKQRKRFIKAQQRIKKMIDTANRPTDKQGRIIKSNVWGEEIVRVKNKWTLRIEVKDSFD